MPLMIELHRTIVIIISPFIIILGIFNLLQTKRDYQWNQCRSKSTSAACLFYHDIYIALAAYSAWFSTWPLLNEDSNLELHLLLYIIGFSIAISSLVIYAMYAFKMQSILRAMGRRPDKLITEGIFNKSRNPQSLARAIGLIALAIWGRSLYSLFLAFLWISINHPYILIEERFLNAIFGDTYLNYCSITPRYCGLLTPIKRLIKK